MYVLPIQTRIQPCFCTKPIYSICTVFPLIWSHGVLFFESSTGRWPAKTVTLNVSIQHIIISLRPESDLLSITVRCNCSHSSEEELLYLGATSNLAHCAPRYRSLQNASRTLNMNSFKLPSLLRVHRNRAKPRCSNNCCRIPRNFSGVTRSCKSTLNWQIGGRLSLREIAARTLNLFAEKMGKILWSKEICVCKYDEIL